MNIGLFNKNYWLRRFSAQTEVMGYLTSTYQDMVVSLNVHPMSTDQLQALPEGERTVKHLEAQSSVYIRASDTEAGVKGDLILYGGEWYECTSAQSWNHTVLSHWNCQFVLVPRDGSRVNDISNPPTSEPIPTGGGMS